MLKNYILTALRNIGKNKIQAFIQVLSLAIGITAAISIGMYILNEFSYDRFNLKGDRIYRVEFGKQVGQWPAIGHQISQEIPEVEKVVRLVNWTGKDRVFSTSYTPSFDSSNVRWVEISDSYWCDSTIFEVFTIPLIQGDPATALRDPGSCVLSVSTARRIFGERDPVGESFWGGGINITGVFEDLENSHIDLNMLISMVSHDSLGGVPRGHPNYLNNYMGPNWMTYLLLPEGTDPLLMEKRIDHFFKEKWKNRFNYEATNNLQLRPLHEVYFSKGLEAEANTFNHGNLDLLKVLMAIAAFILILAIINYVNLSTARASIRAREVGIRKVAGSSKSSLVSQFLVESILVTVFSFLIGLFLVWISLKGLSRLASAELHMNFLLYPGTWMIILVSILFLGTLSGIYPALYMTAFPPVASLSGERFKGRGSLIFRRLLLTFQFTVSIILILGVLVISRQLRFMKTADPGYEKELVVNFSGGNYYWQYNAQQRQLIRERLLQYPGVSNVAFCSTVSGNEQSVSFDPRVLNGIEKTTAWLGIDPDFLALMKIDILQGRNLSWDYPGDYIPTMGDGLLKVIVNETFIREFQLESTGPQIISWDGGYEQEIIGVIPDVHFESMHEQIQPTILGWSSFLPYMSVKLRPGDTKATLDQIQAELVSIFPEDEKDFFKYTFLEESYARQYSKDENTSRIIFNFALVAILLACLGLFGLSTFMANRRVKEIGIRKTFGASDQKVFRLLAREFIKWIVVSVAIGCPLAWIFMQRWLQSFAYRTEIIWWTFLITILFAFVITFLTVSWQSLKTARTNPAESLRDE